MRYIALILVIIVVLLGVIAVTFRYEYDGPNRRIDRWRGGRLETLSCWDARVVAGKTEPGGCEWRAKVWSAIADLVTSNEPVFTTRDLQPIPFSRLYNLKNASRDLGIMSFETLMLGGPQFSDFVVLQRYLGRDGLEQLFEVPKTGLMVLAVWHAVKITPNIRIVEGGNATMVRVGLSVEAFNTVNGWNTLKSKGTIEGFSFVALLKRLR